MLRGVHVPNNPTTTFMKPKPEEMQEDRNPLLISDFVSYNLEEFREAISNTTLPMSSVPWKAYGHFFKTLFHDF